MTDYYSIQSSQDVIEHFGIKGSGYYVHERTMSNSFINKYGANASMYGGRAAEYQRIARKSGLKG